MIEGDGLPNTGGHGLHRDFSLKAVDGHVRITEINSLGNTIAERTTIARYLHQTEAMAQQQFSFFASSPRFFGGALLKGRRKTQRPLAFKRPIHLVLRSEKARGRWSFINTSNRRKIEKWLARFAQKNGLRVYRQATVSNHLHLLIKFPRREAYNSFIRALTGTVPRSIFKFASKTESFWDFRPFTRVVEWGRDYKNTSEYVEQNELEALGFVTYKKRKHRYGRWLKETGALFSGSP